MRLNRFETAMMNHPLRAWAQRHVEVPQLRRLGGPLPGGRVLEVGCGNGLGVELLLDVFGAVEVDAFDLDPAQIDRARRRLAGRERVRLWVGDATAIAAADATYDAVFDFGIIHHVPAWRDALREVHRVLVPGGRFYAEEVLDRFILHPLWRRLLDHPTDDRFDRATFRRALGEAGFRVLGTRGLLGWCAWFAADKNGPQVFGVSRA